MSTHSDIGIAIQTEAFHALSNESRMFLANRFETHLEHEEGHFFHEECWKNWEFIASSYHRDEDVKAFYDDLASLEKDETFRLLVACHDYPQQDDDRNAGDWDDSPWEPVVEISIKVRFSR